MKGHHIAQGASRRDVEAFEMSSGGALIMIIFSDSTPAEFERRGGSGA
jgi:hypothetical protein